MQCFLLQDWVTIRGATATTGVAQSESGWLDLSPFQDIVVWLAVSEITPPTSGGSLFFDIQTAPVRDEVYFLSMIGGATSGIAISAPVSPSVTPLFKDNIGVFTGGSMGPPLSRWLRWKINAGTPTQPWDATFRIWVAANFQRGAGALSRSGATATGPGGQHISVPYKGGSPGRAPHFYIGQRPTPSQVQSPGTPLLTK